MHSTSTVSLAVKYQGLANNQSVVCFVLITTSGINFATGKYKYRDILMIFAEPIYTGVTGIIFKKSSLMRNKFCFDLFMPRYLIRQQYLNVGLLMILLILFACLGASTFQFIIP